jgi:Rad3-related DNA helicase
MKYKGKEVKITPQEINAKLDELIAKDIFGENFTFRPNQRKTVVKIAFLYLNQLCDNVILDAPTGSGKSIIAIVTSKLLREWKKEGYIITSNLELQAQYERDVHQMNLQWGSIKGMANYNCDVNGKSFPQGECKVRGFSNEKIQKLACYNTCNYYMSRLKAIHSSVSILNYSYYLLQRNYVAERQKYANETIAFKERDFIFFDEAHKIDDIVQNHFKVCFSQQTLEKMTELMELLEDEGLLKSEIDTTNLMLDYSAVMDEENFDENMQALRNIRKVLKSLVDTTPDIRSKINKDHPLNFKNKKDIPKVYTKILSGLELIKDINCKIEDYVSIVEKNENTYVKTLFKDKEEVVYNLLEDIELIKMKLHSHVKFGIFMSATFGNPDVWANLTGTKNYEVIQLDTTWDYSKSPIVIMHTPKLTWKNKEKSWPTIVKRFDEILNKHKDERGIVHTGNFSFMIKILKESKYKKRLFTYTNTKEKMIIMPKFKRSKNGILIGPSLLEGIDLPNDLSRFQIFLKVPYRQITDNFTQQKMRYNSKWYSWKTAISITQGIGRSIRNDGDYAVTYLLDGSFKDFIKYNSNILEKFIVDRMHYES